MSSRDERSFNLTAASPGAKRAELDGPRYLRLSLARASRAAAPTAAAFRVLEPRRAEVARMTIRGWPDYAPTPLVSLPGLARRVGAASVWCKDETARFGIGSFKALGGAYAVMCALQDEVERRTGGRPTAEDLRRGRVPAGEITVTTASAGNHGRSVAWGARRFGCRCVVFLPRDAARARADAIRSHGAEVVRFDGDYDAAVGHAKREATRRGWVVVSDTAYPGYEEIPRRVMEGYTLLAEEMLDALEAADAQPLTHLFVQAGVGGLATGVCGRLWERLGTRRPRLVAVEPWRADCIGRSLRTGAFSTVAPPFETAMGGLAAGVPSTAAWQFLQECLDAAIAIPEAAWRAGAEALASGELGAPIRAGPSGAAGVGALLSLRRFPSMGSILGIGPGSRIAVLVTEQRF